MTLYLQGSQVQCDAWRAAIDVDAGMPVRGVTLGGPERVDPTIPGPGWTSSATSDPVVERSTIAALAIPDDQRHRLGRTVNAVQLPEAALLKTEGELPLLLATMLRTRRRANLSATAYGVQTFTDANYYESSGGSAGVADAFWLAVLMSIDSRTGAQPRSIVSKAAPGTVAGCELRTLGVSTTLSFAAASAAGAIVASPAYVVTAGDVGKMLLVIGALEGGKNRLFVKRAEQGAGQAIAGYTPSNAPLRIGRHSSASGQNAAGITVYGVASGHHALTADERDALHEAVMDADDIQAVPDKTDHLYSVRLDQTGSAPAQITDRIGTHHLTKQGSPTLAPTTARAWGW